MDVDGEAKAQRKVSPLTFLPVFIFIFIFFFTKFYHSSLFHPFCLLLLLKKEEEEKKGGGHLSFSRPGRLLRVCTSVRRSSVAARRCFPTLLMLAQWAYREGRRRDAAAEEEGKKPKRERIFNWHLPPSGVNPSVKNGARRHPGPFSKQSSKGGEEMRTETRLTLIVRVRNDVSSMAKSAGQEDDERQAVSSTTVTS